MSIAGATATDRFVVVTGASTGIGKACALRLDGEGFSVFATVRKPSDGASLKAEASERLQPLLLDVTDKTALAAAVQEVGERTGRQLYGLVNNAGIAIGGPLECVSIEEIRQVIEVNVIGLMAMTQAFLPFLKSPHGRIVNIGSASGLVAIPLMSPYAASKFAVQAVSDSLRVELKPLGISVSLIAAGKVQSEIWEKARSHKSDLLQTLDLEILAPYQPFLKYFEKELQATDALPTEEAVKAVFRALTARNPRPRYLVGNDAVGAAIVAKLPVRLRDWLIAKTFGV